MRAALAALGALAMSPAAAATPEGPPAAEVQAVADAYVGAVNADSGVAAYLARDVQPVPSAVIRAFFEDQRWINGGGVELIGARLRPGRPAKVEVAVRNRIYGGIQGGRAYP